MAGEKTTLPSRTPARTPQSEKKAVGSVGKQQSILGFFTKHTPSSSNQPTSSSVIKSKVVLSEPPSSPCLQESKRSMNELPRLPRQIKQTTFKKHSNVTPIPRSDPLEPSGSQENTDRRMARALASKALLESSPTRYVWILPSVSVFTY